MTDYSDVWFASKDGLSLYARDYRARVQSSADVELPTIICLPGLTRNSADFSVLCEHLSSSFRVVAVDLRGRGNSDHDPNPMNYHPGIYAEDMGELITHLKLTSIILIGTSLGGLVSMFLAALHASKIIGVVLNDIGPEINSEGLVRIRNYVCDRPVVKDWAGAVKETREKQGAEYPDFTQQDWESFTRNLYRENAAGIPELNYDENIAVPIKLAEELPSPSDLWSLFDSLLSMPVLLFRGELSDILTAACAEKMVERHPKLNLVTVHSRGHAPLLTEPQALESIDSFLEKVVSVDAVTVER